MSSQSGEDLGLVQFSKGFSDPDTAKATQWILELYDSDAKLFTKEMLDAIEDGLEKNKPSVVLCSAYTTIIILFKELKLLTNSLSQWRKAEFPRRHRQVNQEQRRNGVSKPPLPERTFQITLFWTAILLSSFFPSRPFCTIWQSLFKTTHRPGPVLETMSP
jgi:hypothetical protein